LWRCCSFDDVFAGFVVGFGYHNERILVTILGAV
jgi:hypothetical protein